MSGPSPICYPWNRKTEYLAQRADDVRSPPSIETRLHPFFKMTKHVLYTMIFSSQTLGVQK